MTPHTPVRVLLLDSEEQPGGLDALAASVAMFGAHRFELLYAHDLDTLYRMAGELASVGSSAVIVVDVDHNPEPKQILAAAVEAGYPLAVLSDGCNDAIADHALAVAADAYLPLTLPARELVDVLANLASEPEPVWD